ncbi:CDP-diacylglycerol--glycerol-3-phosphate 3-phosphatidyltransferase, partial [Parasutterella excrementihominis]
MDKSVKKVRINIPMVLTWTRIALIPLIVGVFMIPTSVLSMHSQNLLGCIFFIVAAVTDALDGFIARRYGMGTTLGAFLDPVADKLMVSAALIVLLAFGRVDMLVALVIIGREITVSALREWMARVGESGKVKVNWFGKIKAIAQMVSIPMLLYFDPIGAWNVYLTGTILIY